MVCGQQDTMQPVVPICGSLWRFVPDFGHKMGTRYLAPKSGADATLVQEFRDQSPESLNVWRDVLSAAGILNFVG